MAGRRRMRAAGRQTLASINPNCCALCRREINESKDQLVFGSTERGKNFSVHYFCMLFSSNLIQEGEDDQGIKGFLERSIIGEIGRGASFLCAFCRKPGATIGCVDAKCRRVVHFPCGLENGATFDFASPNFETFCSSHKPFPEDVVRDADSKCSICIRNFKRLPRHAFRPVTCPTCQNSFHINCLRKTAAKSGIHHFRCPFCRDDKTFVVHCQRSGIYIPDQDAAWELDDAFNDHYEVLLACNAFQCLCPGGRTLDTESWDIASCITCGLNAAHARCRNLSEDGVYICPDCTPIPPAQKEGDAKRSSNEWFYTKSRFHFREPGEVVQLLKETDSEVDVDIDIDSDSEEMRLAPAIEKQTDSSQESSLDLVLEESDGKSSSGEDPSTWCDFHVRFTKDECEFMSNHLPSLPPRLRDQLPEKMDHQPSCSSPSRPPLSQLQGSYAETSVGKSFEVDERTSEESVSRTQSNHITCLSIM